MIERRALLWFYGFCYSVFWSPAALQACMDSFDGGAASEQRRDGFNTGGIQQ